jgi:hypothetical protein
MLTCTFEEYVETAREYRFDSVKKLSGWSVSQSNEEFPESSR